MFSFITTNLIWSESLWIPILCFGIAILGWIFFKPLFYGAIILFLFCFYFFRNPERVCPEAFVDSNVIVCPADGTIVDLSYDPNGGFKGYHHKISIFLSPLNVHVNWTPVAGTIEKVEYVPGKFMMAFLPKSSELNEHNDISDCPCKRPNYTTRQIAGTVARRIVCWVQEDDRVAAGQKYGMIKFSSRVDLLLPEDVKIEVSAGQKVYGGKTVIGRLAMRLYFIFQNTTIQVKKIFFDSVFFYLRKCVMWIYFSSQTLEEDYFLGSTIYFDLPHSWIYVMADLRA